MRCMKLWSWQKENLPSIGHSVRTALAATVAVVVARLVQMPEAYWAAIATLVVMQSSLGATLTLSLLSSWSRYGQNNIRFQRSAQMNNFLASCGRRKALD